MKWDEVSFSQLSWVPELVISQKPHVARKTRFMMNVNIRTDFKSAVRLKNKSVETSLELACMMHGYTAD